MSFEILQILGLIPNSVGQGEPIPPTPPQPLAFVSVQSGGIGLTDVITDLTLPNVPIVASTSEHRIQLVLVARNNVYNGTNSTAIQDVKRGATSLMKFVTFGTTIPLSCAAPEFCMRMEAWYELNPAPGNANIVISTLGTGTGGGAGLIASAWQFNGVNQSTPFGTPVNAGSVINQHSLNISSAIGEIVIAWISARHFHDLTEPGGSQTNRYEERHHGPVSDDRHAESKGATLPGAATVNARWDNAGSNKDESMTAGFAIIPA